MRYLFNDTSYIILFCSVISISVFFFRNFFERKFELYDYPNNFRKVHKKKTSTINGLILFLSINTYLILSFFFDVEIYNNNSKIIFLILSSIFFLVGYFDDKKNLSPSIKSFIILLSLTFFLPIEKNFIVQILEFRSLPNLILNLKSFSVWLTIFFIFIFYNFLNFADGANGIAISLCIFFILVKVLNTGQISIFELIIILNLFFCLILNLKNITFLGNSGVSFLGLIISLIYIDQYNQNKGLLCDEIFFIFFIPGIDMTRLVIHRISRGKFIYESDNEHLHHYLMKIFKHRNVFIIYLIIAILPWIIFSLIQNFFVSFSISLALYLFTLIRCKII